MAKRWFVVHTYSGYENKVKTDLEHRVETYGVGDRIVDIQIPTEEVTEIKDGGKRETKETKVFPGYVLVRMECDRGVVDDHLWQIVRNTPGVTGFVGIDGKPTPLRREEFNKIMRRTNPRGVDAAAQKRTTTTTELEVGMAVRVVSGPLADFDGQVSEVMPEAGKVRVMVSIFGRDTPVELLLDQVTIIA
jgi:transcriptional antiterminator NusG